MTQFILNGLCTGAVYAVVGLGFGFILHAARIFHIAHGAIYTVAAYVCFALARFYQLPLVVAAGIAVTVGSILGIVIEEVLYRPLRHSRCRGGEESAPMIITSLGAFIAIVSVVVMIFGNETRVLRPGADVTFGVADGLLTKGQLCQLVAAAAIIVVVATFLRYAPLGRTLRALADDPELVGLLGYNARLLRILVFAIGSALASLGAILAAVDIGFDPYVGLDAVLAAAVAAILGGRGRFMGPALGGLLLGLLQGVVVWQTSSRWASTAVFGSLVILLVFRPSGILASSRRVEEL